MAPIDADVVREGERLLAIADDAGLGLRLLGGVAISLRAPRPLPPTLQRSFGDLDFVSAYGASAGLSRLFQGRGYEPHRAFNALHGRRRLIFLDAMHGRQVDIFVGEFSMCHEIPVAERLELEPRTLPLAELLLTKLQIVQLNEKDVRDTLALFHGHEVGEKDGDGINAARIAELCASDWGLWRTITANLAACRGHVGDYDLGEEENEAIAARIGAVLDRIEGEPKSRGWRLRAKIGERVRWYDLPEEVAEGA
jgi:hypothetical protein